MMSECDITIGGEFLGSTHNTCEIEPKSYYI